MYIYPGCKQTINMPNVQTDFTIPEEITKIDANLFYAIGQ